jgi:hypothetical protein
MLIVERMKRKYVLLIAAVLVLSAVPLLSCNTPADPLADLAITHNMTVQNFSGSNNSVAVVSGSVINNGAHSIPNLTIDVVFFDQNGKTLDKASAVTGNLLPGGMWNFSVQSKGVDAWKIVNYKVTPVPSR